MGHNSSSNYFPNYVGTIETKEAKGFEISYHGLMEHILLLRKVIRHPEMTKQGLILNNYIDNYCKRMAQVRLRTRNQQSKLPWQIEWIWHVHRLHPVEYLNDCEKQLSDGLVDKQTETLLLMNYKKRIKSKRKFFSKDYRSLFVPSIDLSNAIIQQKDFLEKFQKHFLYSYDLHQINRVEFINLVKDYISFIKLARNNQMSIPTFDIDLIWHTHMRYPSNYNKFSLVACGFIRNYDDSIEQSMTLNADQITGDRWKEIYKPKLELNINSNSNTYRSSSGMGLSYGSTNTSKPSHSKSDHDYGSTNTSKPSHSKFDHDYGSTNTSKPSHSKSDHDYGSTNTSKPSHSKFDHDYGSTNTSKPSHSKSDHDYGSTNTSKPSHSKFDHDYGSTNTSKPSHSKSDHDYGSTNTSKPSHSKFDHDYGSTNTSKPSHSKSDHDYGSTNTSKPSHSKFDHDYGSTNTSKPSHSKSDHDYGSTNTSKPSHSKSDHDYGSSGTYTHTFYDVGSYGGNCDSGGSYGGGDSGGGGDCDGGGD